MKQLLIAVSGGRSSGLMARHIQTSKRYSDYEKLFVFCNTGQERPQTWQFLKDMVHYWEIPLVLLEGVYSLEKGIGVKHKIVDFDTADMKSEVFKQAIAHMNKNKWVGVPNQAVPYCSEYLKRRVSHSFAKQIFGTPSYITAIGYRFEDMPKRITFAELREDKTKIAPLLTDFISPVTQLDLNVYYDDQPFKLGIHSKLGNCKICNKASDRNLIERLQFGVDTDTIDFYRSQETEYGNMFFRGNKSIDDLIALAASGTQLDMFNNSNADSCICTF